MAKEIYGSFQTKEEAAKVINVLSLKGFPANKIQIFTSQKNPRELTKVTDGIIVHVKEGVSKKPASYFEKLFLKVSDCEMNIHDRLRDEGLSGKQAEKYTNDIHSGNIVIIADNKLKMGHESPDQEFATEVPLMNNKA